MLKSAGSAFRQTDDKMAQMRSISGFSRVFALAAFALIGAYGQSPHHATRNVVFVMSDGLRWQEVFSGLDPLLMNKENGVEDPERLKRLYWRESPVARREALMPFLWSVVARQGQIYGNRKRGSDAYVTNGLNFSYPGYSETLCGFPDPRIDSNDKIPNPNVTVFEWLHNRPGYRGKVAAFGAWDTFPAIFNAERAGFPVNAGYDRLTGIPETPELRLLNALKDELPRVWEGEPFDAITFHTAMEYLQARRPRLLYVSLGETDEWAHAGHYADYVEAVHRADAFLATLWNTLQSLPEYRGATTLIFSPDHGRGEAPREWKDHGQKIPDSKYIWMAFLGPDTRALGERSEIAPVTQNQIAATLAALLGEDYRSETPRAGKPIADVLPR
jgi:hypothetical protein